MVYIEKSTKAKVLKYLFRQVIGICSVASNEAISGMNCLFIYVCKIVSTQITSEAVDSTEFDIHHVSHLEYSLKWKRVHHFAFKTHTLATYNK